jgi:hypothetical protein
MLVFEATAAISTSPTTTSTSRTDIRHRHGKKTLLLMLSDVRLGGREGQGSKVSKSLRSSKMEGVRMPRVSVHMLCKWFFFGEVRICDCIYMYQIHDIETRCITLT